MHCQNLLFDPARIPSPCFVLDEAQLLANAATLGAVQERTGAKILLALKGYAACLRTEGVKYVFGIPGEENIKFVRAVAASGDIRFILARHEQGASLMADIYGRLTGKAGVCTATLGPGAINLLLGAADAQTNSSPLVAISAQVGLKRIYKESHQIVDLVGMFKPVTKWADTVLTPQAVPEMVRNAFQVAQEERPGATYLAIPEDVEAAPMPEAVPLKAAPCAKAIPSPAAVAEAAALLRCARKPVIMTAKAGRAISVLKLRLKPFSSLVTTVELLISLPAAAMVTTQPTGRQASGLRLPMMRGEGSPHLGQGSCPWDSDALTHSSNVC